MTGPRLALVASRSPAPPLAPPVPRPPERPPWRLPSRAGRVATTLVVLAAAAAVARFFPLRQDLLSTEIAGAREVVAYQLVAGEPLALALPPGAELIRVLSNLDLPPDAPDPGVPYLLRVRVPDEGRDDRFPLLARPARDPRGAPAAFFLRSQLRPARTRILTLVRASSRPATLEITLQAPGPARASLRVLVANRRMTPEPVPTQASKPVGALPLEELAPEVRDAFTSLRWSRISARSKSPTRTFYLVGEPFTPERDRGAQGEPIGPGQALAYTVKGPGTLELHAPLAPLTGGARVRALDGGEKVQPLSLALGGRVSLAVGPGLQTVRVTSESAGWLRVIASAPAMAAAPEQLRPAQPTDGQEVELRPAWSRQLLPQSQSGGSPVEYAMAGRGEAALRVSARVRLDDATKGPARLRWTFVDARGQRIGQGSFDLDATPAPEDRLETAAGPAPVSQPVAFYLWPPAGAEHLRFESERAALLSVASPGYPPDPAAPPPLAIALLRYAPEERRPFYAIQPVNAELLLREGRIARFAGAFRIEPPPPPDPPPGDAQSLLPSGDGGRFALIEPLQDADDERRPGRFWEIERERDQVVSIPRPTGASRRARVPATLLYQLGQLRGAALLTVRVDGQVVRRASVLATRGQIALPPLPVGKHRLRVELPADGRFFVDQPVAGGAAFRKTQVFVLPDGRTRVGLAKGAAARALGVVVYLDHAPARAEAVELEATVDGNLRHRRRGGGWSRFFTRLQRRIPLRFLRTPGAIYLNRTGGQVWASAPVFFRLGDDLAAGSHVVTLRTRGLGARPSARFFSYGGPALSRINQHIEMRAEVSP